MQTEYKYMYLDSYEEQQVFGKTSIQSKAKVQTTESSSFENMVLNTLLLDPIFQDSISGEEIIIVNPIDNGINRRFLNKSSIVTQHWSGEITNVDKESGCFVGVLKNKKNTNEEISVEFSFEEVSENNRQYILEGACFAWIVGRQTLNGQRQNFDKIDFYRFPNFRNQVIDGNSDKVSELKSWLKNADSAK